MTNKTETSNRPTRRVYAVKKITEEKGHWGSLSRRSRMKGQSNANRTWTPRGRVAQPTRHCGRDG